MKHGTLRPQGKVLDHWQLLHESDFEDTDTKLLLHLDGDVTDYATGKTVTNNAAFSTSVWKFGSQSSSFNGSSQYLSTPITSDFDFGSGNFTIDFWVNFVALPTDTNSMYFFGVGSSTYTVYMRVSNSGGVYTVTANMDKVGGGAVNPSGTYAFSTATWYHLTWVRTGNDHKLFVNGAQIGSTTTDSGSHSTPTGGTFNIGANYTPGIWLNGYIDEFRVVKGTAKWTSNFTPPTAPYLGRTTTYPITRDRNTVLMISGEGADTSTSIIDETGKAVTAVGTAQIDTAQFKFGQSSVLLDGNSDYLTLVNSEDWNLGIGNFTFDCWVRFNAINENQCLFEKDSVGDETDFYRLEIDSSNKLKMKFVNSSTTKGDYIMTNAWSGLSTGVWYHVAFIRSGTTGIIFIDGVSQSLTVNTAFGSNSIDSISSILGIGQSGTNSNYFNGWLDDIRITKGLARWTSNFTPPLKTTALINGDTDEEYKLDVEIVTGSGNPNFGIKLNGDTNYGYQMLLGENSTIEAHRNTSSYIQISDGSLTTGDISWITSMIYAKSGYVRTILLEGCQDVSGTTVGRADLWGWSWNNTTAPIALLQMYSDTTDGFSVGTKFLLYRKVI